MEIPSAIAISGSLKPRARKRSRFMSRMKMVATDTSRNLAMDFPSSTSDCTENIFFNPASGFSLDSLGCTACIEKLKPPNNGAIPIAATTSTMNSGTSAVSATQPDSSRRCMATSGSCRSSALTWKLMRKTSSPAWISMLPNMSRPMAPKIITATLPNSRERAIWPFLRASSIFLTEGSSERSLPSSFSAIASQPALRLFQNVRHQHERLVTEHFILWQHIGQRQPDDHQPENHGEGKAHCDNVHLRRHPADDTECNVHHQQRNRG